VSLNLELKNVKKASLGDIENLDDGDPEIIYFKSKEIF